MVSKILYQPISIALGITTSVVVGKAFNQVWDNLDGDGDGVPRADDQAAPMSKVLIGAALRATTFAVTRQLVDRQGRRFYYHLTGFWPGKADPQLVAGDASALRPPPPA